ncbi:MAG: hypothetical protein NTZ16_13370 [Verrucomicrobia bacterium]|nr:hypothetical protein [Verrucomicrobiota bacterium]
MHFVRRAGAEHAENPVGHERMSMQIANEILPAAARVENAAGQGLFTPCAGGGSLLKTSPAAAKTSVSSGGAVLLSPVCSGFGQFRQEQNLAEPVLREENFNGPGFFEEKFPATNQRNQPTTTTSKKGRDSR